MKLAVWTGCVLLCTLLAPAKVEPLTIARSLAKTTYDGYTYGTGEKQIDCTTFVRAVVLEAAKECGKTIDKQHLRTLAVVLSEEDQKVLQKLVDDCDDKIKGVQKALVDAKLGVVVERGDARPGDLVQYWYKERGAWVGHAGIVEKIEAKKATIYGSHKTTLQPQPGRDTSKGGIGSGPVFDLSENSRKVFVVRWTAEKP